jgi:hypothetical protein
MREIGNRAIGSVTRRLLGLRRYAFPTGGIRFSNRKSGIRIRSKSRELNTIQISNRKYSQLFDPGFDRFPRSLIYGSAIKSSRNTLKRNYIRISNRRQIEGNKLRRKPRSGRSSRGGSWGWAGRVARW